MKEFLDYYPWASKGKLDKGTKPEPPSVQNVEGSFIITWDNVVPRSSAIDTWVDGVGALGNLILIASIFAKRKEIKLWADNKDKKTCCKYKEMGRKEVVCERENQPGKCILINGQHEESS